MSFDLKSWLLMSLLTLGCAYGQSQNPPDPPPDPPAPVQPAATQPPDATQPQGDVAPPDKRIFGVLPNYRTADVSQPFQTLTPGQKMHIGLKDSTDWPVYPTAAAFSLLYQLENQNPSFGQGMKGYAKRFAGAYGDQTIGNLMTESLVPIITKQDPRYYPKMQGTKWQRAS